MHICSAFIDCTNSNEIPPDHFLKLSLDKIKSQFGDIPVYYSSTSTIAEADKWGAIYENPQQQIISINKILKKHAKQDQDSLALFYHFYPLLDAGLCKESLERHNKYLAHLTYGENIPLGFMPDYLSLEFIKLVPEDLNSAIREFVFKNIETYDLELFYKLPDLRQSRLDLSTKSARSIKLLNDIFDLDPNVLYVDMQKLLLQHPEILRPYPSCFEIELTGQRQVQPIYKPKNNPVDLDFNLLKKLLNDISNNGLTNDSTLLFSGTGDAFFYEHIIATLESAISNENISQIIVETWLTLDDLEKIKQILELDHNNKLSIVIRLSSINNSEYNKIYGKNMLKQVLKNIEEVELILQSLQNPPSVYIEMLRMNENDSGVDDFMKMFENKKITPILGKFNSFIDLLPDRRAIDLTPLKRDFCWHLARDFYLNVSGQVAICKQDPECEKHAGIDFKEFSVQEIYSKTKASFVASFRGEHKKTGIACLDCDEWYTFNM